MFSSAEPTEQILVRMDDKLSRLKSRQADEDEDVMTDLLGYMILYKVAQHQANKQLAQEVLQEAYGSWWAQPQTPPPGLDTMDKT